MKKQGTFANVVKFHHNVHGHQQDSPMSRYTGLQYSKRAPDSVNLSSGLRTLRLPAPSRHMKTIHIPKTMAKAPYLANSYLTPGQRRYLHTIADTCSMEHVHKLIQQHYMNVLHRCIQAGQHLVKDDIMENLEVESLPYEHESEIQKHSGPKNRERKGSVLSGKTTLPKIPNRHLRTFSDNSPSKQRKAKKHTANRVATMKKPKPRRFELWKDDLPFDLEADDSLSECLSSLSMREEEYDHMGLTASPVNLPDL
ncbi:protein FAM216A [Hypomesus transpacificus]|uniref:protein FAM216A n=1 Tax=Hypomesus transpacificus TaxID=137520 RepID=UPI001F07B30B|nr:protein FAM216A [Hypomesus transpacificus]